jgi:hypothetical protein
MNMFVCIDCGLLFEDPKHYTETHGLDTPPYEEWNGCPLCAGAYTTAYRCDGCDQWITEKYVKIGADRYCEECYDFVDLGDEE